MRTGAGAGRGVRSEAVITSSSIRHRPAGRITAGTVRTVTGGLAGADPAGPTEASERFNAEMLAGPPRPR